MSQLSGEMPRHETNTKKPAAIQDIRSIINEFEDGDLISSSHDISGTNAESLSLFQKILIMTDGTVTDLIKLYARESIRIKKLEQQMVMGGAPEVLCCDDSSPLLRRSVLLHGQQKNYVFARSFFVFERLSRSIQYRLLETDIPIGLMWKEEMTEMFRKVIECKIEACGLMSEYFNVEPETPMISRTYSIHCQKKPFGVITEKFPFTYFR